MIESENISSMALMPSHVSAQRIDELDIGEVLLVISDDDAAIGFGHSGDDRVEGTNWPAGRLACGHQPSPNQTGRFVERQYTTGEKSLWTLWA